MKLLVFIFTFCISMDAAAQHQPLTLFDQLVYVNKEWANQEDVPSWLRQTSARPFTEQQLVQFHLQQVELLLRKRSTTPFSTEQRIQRAKNLDVLHAYWNAGQFPVNTDHQNRQPYFIDHYGTYCAVGYLMKMSGADTMARSIHDSQNYSFLVNIKHPALMNWVYSSGLRLGELALVQPGYGGEMPAVLTEMHYNNTGTDVNEYIEIRQAVGGLIGFFPFDSVLFADYTGTIYKRLHRNDMVTGPGGSFLYYTFPSNESFADSGIIRIRCPNTFFTDYYQQITYNSTSVTISGRYCGTPPPYCPDSTIVYNVSENEGTPAGNSLGFCGQYGTSGWNLLAGPNSVGVLNTCASFPVPVVLTQFSYTLSGKNVILNWETASENNSSQFIIERSPDGYQFSPVGTIAAAGNSSDTRRYSFTDQTPAYINHYRLKQVDIDGKFKYSKILYVKQPQQNPVDIISNPVTDVLKLNIKGTGTGNIFIYDDMGRKQKVISVRSPGTLTAGISALPAGTYLLIFTTDKAETFSQFFIKAR